MGLGAHYATVRTDPPVILARGHANLLCILPILVYVLPKRAHATVRTEKGETGRLIELSTGLQEITRIPIILFPASFSLLSVQ